MLETIERRRLPIAFPIEMRVVRGDDAPLSTAHGRDSVYIAVHQFRGQEFETYFRAVEAIMDSYGGRPHWGKRHYQSAATLRERYPRWDDWHAARDRLDPGRTFANDYTRRVLGERAGLRSPVARQPAARRRVTGTIDTVTQRPGRVPKGHGRVASVTALPPTQPAVGRARRAPRGRSCPRRGRSAPRLPRRRR